MSRDSLAPMMEHDMELWRYWGFETWSAYGMSGVKRRVTFLKPALLGDVAKYYADDIVVWQTGTEETKKRLWAAVSPEEDLMTQRFLFLEWHEKPLCRIRSFLFGIRGYLEFHSYWPGQKFDSRLKDLIPLVERAVDLLGKTAPRGGGNATDPHRENATR